MGWSIPQRLQAPHRYVHLQVQASHLLLGQSLKGWILGSLVLILIGNPLRDPAMHQITLRMLLIGISLVFDFTGTAKLLTLRGTCNLEYMAYIHLVEEAELRLLEKNKGAAVYTWGLCLIHADWAHNDLGLLGAAEQWVRRDIYSGFLQLPYLYWAYPMCIRVLQHGQAPVSLR